MEYNYIDLVFNSSGNPTYVSYPDVINQYATNYIIRVYSYATASKVSASIRTISVLPERILFQSTSESMNANGVILKPVYTYQLTQFDTYAYVNSITITINIKSVDNTVFNHTISIPMVRGSYATINPNLEDDNTLNSLIKEVDTISKYLAISSVTGNPLGTSTEADPDTMVLRDENGRSKIADPEAEEDIVNKRYVDNLDVQNLKLPSVTPSEELIVSISTSGLQSYKTLSQISSGAEKRVNNTGTYSEAADHRLVFEYPVSSYIANLTGLELQYADNSTNQTNIVSVKFSGFKQLETGYEFTGCLDVNTFLKLTYDNAIPTEVGFYITGDMAPTDYTVITATLVYEE